MVLTGLVRVQVAKPFLHAPLGDLAVTRAQAAFPADAAQILAGVITTRASGRYSPGKLATLMYVGAGEKQAMLTMGEGTSEWRKELVLFAQRWKLTSEWLCSWHTSRMLLPRLTSRRMCIFIGWIAFAFHRVWVLSFMAPD